MAESATHPFAQRLGFWLGPLGGLSAALLAQAFGQPAPLAITVAVTVWCALWWMLEPLPGAVTALLPLGILPLSGVLSAKEVAQSYGNELVLLLGGGFMIAQALQRNDAHRRLALWMISAFGGRSGRQLLWGFSLAAGAISMWISNTATTLMLLPVAMAVLADYPDRRLAAPVGLAIAYGASIGGMGTPIGTPPNLVFMQVYEQTTGTRIGFLEWMSYALPAVIPMLILMSLYLGRGLAGAPAAVLPQLGPLSSAEKRVLGLFALIAVAWITRTEPFGGWSLWLGLPNASDASVALLGVVALCMIPDGRGSRLLDWDSAERIPWGALVLFGGGIALATAFERSGLSQLLAGHLSALGVLPTLLLIGVICVGVTLLSEIASNTAAAVLIVPILATTALAIDVEPALLMFPAVLAASCGFMLPVATAPNLIVYGSRLVDSGQMLRAGWVMDLLGATVLTLVCYWVFR